MHPALLSNFHLFNMNAALLVLSQLHSLILDLFSVAQCMIFGDGPADTFFISFIAILLTVFFDGSPHVAQIIIF